MTLEEITLMLSRVNWDLALGLSVVPLFLFLSILYLVRGEWPWDKQYRSVSLAGLFLLLATWSAAGLSGIAGAFWFFVYLGIIAGGLWWAYGKWTSWMGSLPVPHQVYNLKGVGEVKVILVQTGEVPFFSLTTYRGPNGMDATVPTTTFLRQGELLVEDDDSEMEELDYEPLSNMDQARKSRAAQLSKLSL